MKRTFAIRITVAAFLASDLSGWTYSRLLAEQKPKAPAAELKGDRVAAPRNVEVRQPGRLGTIVQGVEDRDPDFKEAITRAFRRAPVPPSRLLAFATFDHPNFRVDGWLVLIRDIEDVPGGKHLKAGVSRSRAGMVTSRGYWALAVVKASFQVVQPSSKARWSVGASAVLESRSWVAGMVKTPCSRELQSPLLELTYQRLTFTRPARSRHSI